MKGIISTILFFSFFITSLSAQELTGTLEQINISGTIKVGYRQFYPPLSFLDENGIPAGYSIDLCEEIVSGIQKKMGRTIDIEYIPVTSEGRFSALVDKKIDLLCGATTKTLSRSEIVDFTQIIFVTGASFMTMAGNNIKGNFAGKKIGVIKDTTTEIELKKLFEETKINTTIVFVKSTLEGRKALEKGEIDALAADQVVLIGLALNSDDPGRYSILPDLFSYEPLALAVRRNDADFRLAADRVISGLCRSEQMLTIYDKWFSEFSSIRPSAFDMLVELNALPE
jgi:glutamate/aspartate transport system substrate-binding protein